MASSAVTVKQASYSSHSTITMSDHRPVSAGFEVQVRLCFSFTGPKTSGTAYASFYPPKAPDCAAVRPPVCLPSSNAALFAVQVPVVSLPEYETFVERIWRDVSSAEYVEERPRVRVGPTNIDFSPVSYVFLVYFWQLAVIPMGNNSRYKRPVVRTLEIENTGKVGGLACCRMIINRLTLPTAGPVRVPLRPSGSWFNIM